MSRVKCILHWASRFNMLYEYRISFQPILKIRNKQESVSIDQLSREGKSETI